MLDHDGRSGDLKDQVVLELRTTSYAFSAVVSSG